MSVTSISITRPNWAYLKTSLPACDRPAKTARVVLQVGAIRLSAATPRRDSTPFSTQRDSCTVGLPYLRDRSARLGFVSPPVSASRGGSVQITASLALVAGVSGLVIEQE